MILEGIINTLLNIIPTFTIGIDIVASLAQMAAFLGYTNYYIAVDAFGIAAGVTITCWIVCAVPSLIISLL